MSNRKTTLSRLDSVLRSKTDDGENALLGEEGAMVRRNDDDFCLKASNAAVETLYGQHFFLCIKGRNGRL